MDITEFLAISLGLQIGFIGIGQMAVPIAFRIFLRDQQQIKDSIKILLD